MYYLQSRYYNPEIGRFINTDALASGQNLLGNNMFAYCVNNPVCDCDPSGNLTKRQIHDMVLTKIIEEQQSTGRTTLTMNDTCIYYNKKNAAGRWGFCDLYDSVTGEVWELKRSTCNMNKAIEQLKGYVAGALKHNKELPLTVGKRLYADGYIGRFTYTDDSGTYNVWYWDNGNGILNYDYTYQKSTTKKVSDGLQIGLLALGAVACGVTALASYGTVGTAETISVVIVLIDTVSKVA